MSSEKKRQWAVVWETGDGPEVDGPYANEEEALDRAYASWCEWAGGIVGGYSSGSRSEFDDVYAETDKVWIVPLGSGS